MNFMQAKKKKKTGLKCYIMAGRNNKMPTYTELCRNEVGVCGSLDYTPRTLAKRAKESAKNQNSIIRFFKQFLCTHYWYDINNEGLFIEDGSIWRNDTGAVTAKYTKYLVPRICLNCGKEENHEKVFYDK